LLGAGDLGQLDFSAVSPVVIGANFALDIMVGQHGVVQGDSALGRVALSLVLVIIDAVNIDNSFVVLSRVPLDLNDSGVAASLDLVLAHAVPVYDAIGESTYVAAELHHLLLRSVLLILLFDRIHLLDGR
jgi:hypothetical protein